MTLYWQGYTKEKKQLRAFKKKYLDSGKDIIKQAQLMKEYRQIFEKGLICTQSDDEQKVQYSFDVLRIWEQLRFPGLDELRSELKIDEYIDYYKTINEGYKETDWFRMYFGTIFPKDPELEEKYPAEILNIRKNMVFYIETGLELKKATKQLKKLVKHTFSSAGTSAGIGFRSEALFEQLKDALEKNPSLNPEIKMTPAEKIGAQKLIRKIYAHLNDKEEKLKKILEKNRRDILKTGRMAKKGKLWLFTGTYFGFKVNQVEELIYFIRRRFWSKIKTYPVANIEMKEFNRTYDGLTDYFTLKSYVHRPLMKYHAKRIFKKIDTNILPTKKYAAFEVLLGNNKIEQALSIKNSLKFSGDDLFNLDHEMEAMIKNYHKFEELFS